MSTWQQDLFFRQVQKWRRPPKLGVPSLEQGAPIGGRNTQEARACVSDRTHGHLERARACWRGARCVDRGALWRDRGLFQWRRLLRAGRGACTRPGHPERQRDRETEREREKERKRRTDRQTEQSVCAAWTPHAISSRSRTYWASQTSPGYRCTLQYCTPKATMRLLETHQLLP